MTRSLNKILVICEGARTEKKVLKAYAEVLRQDLDIHFYGFGGIIYELYNEIKTYDKSFSLAGTVDTLFVLREFDRRKHGRVSPDLIPEYDYIYLIFDADFQDRHKGKADILNKMQRLFNDETESGLLLLNYPMFESFRDFRPPLPDAGFRNRTYEYAKALREYDRSDWPKQDIGLLNETRVPKYKKLVDLRGCSDDFHRYSLMDFEKIVCQNVSKINFILTGSYVLPAYETLTDFEIFEKILARECRNFQSTHKYVDVLCLGILIYLMVFGKPIYASLEKMAGTVG